DGRCGGSEARGCQHRERRLARPASSRESSASIVAAPCGSFSRAARRISDTQGFAARGHMTETFTLVHMSDVHLGPLEGVPLRHLNTKRALGYLNWQRGRRFVHLRSVADRIAADALAQTPDHIAVTGDLANLGLPGEYAGALAWLEALGDPQRVSVVPGNHDIYTGRLGGDSCLRTWAPFMRNSESWTEDETVRFPYVRTQGPVALIGLNSAVPTPPFVAAGQLGEGQIAQLAACLERLKEARYIRVVL